MNDLEAHLDDFFRRPDLDAPTSPVALLNGVHARRAAIDTRRRRVKIVTSTLGVCAPMLALYVLLQPGPHEPDRQPPTRPAATFTTAPTASPCEPEHIRPQDKIPCVSSVPRGGVRPSSP